MAKQTAFVAILVSAFCFSSALAHDGQVGQDKFAVEGKIYCDPCRLGFETRVSHPLSDMMVTLVCRKEENEAVTYKVEGKTDANGFYSLPVVGDHQDEICELMTEKSSHHKCKDPMPNRQSDRIVLTKNSGVASSKRFVNPLGFMTHTIDARCIDIAKELRLDQNDY